MINLSNVRQRYFILSALMISSFYVFFLWRFWTYGIEALGINVSFFWMLMIGFFLLAKWNDLSQRTFLWLAPFTVMIISLSIYTNPFTTWISVLIAPIIFFIFTTHESHHGLRAILWSKFLPFTLIFSAFKFLSSLIPGLSFYKSINHEMAPVDKKNLGNITKQVVLGLAILFMLSVLVIIPLLSSADESFARVFANFFEALANFFKFLNFTSFMRLVNLFFGFIILMGGVYYWRRSIIPFRIAKNNGENSTSGNSITVGIILLGVLALYVLFIFIQAKTIFVSELLSDFASMESLVKTGFWQLFLLTILNILFYVGIYSKYAKNVQRILMAFTLASLLLIVSAGYKVLMYVTDYGLSYEKFFAFYTVIFCVLVFAWFISLFVRQGNERVNIICSLAFMTLWMYAFFAITPIERIIFTTNLQLTQRPNSRINFGDLKMLGSDMLPVVEKNFDKLIVEARKDNIRKNKNNSMEILESLNYNQEEVLQKRVDDWWIKWIEKNRDDQKFLKKYKGYVGKGESQWITVEKKWYEKTFGELFYKPKIKI